MGRPEPEFSAREAELFQQHVDWQPVQPEGLLDTVVQRTRSIANSRTLIERLQEAPPDRLSLDSERLLRWHRAIFRPAKHPAIGRFRVPDDGPIGFGVPVLDQKSDQPTTLWVVGAPPEEIPSRLRAAFHRFHELAPNARERGVAAAAQVVAELQTEVITIHPFVDGNSRTTNVLTQAALHYLGQPEFDWAPKDWKLAAARSYAVRPDEKRSVDRLTDLIAARITAQDPGTL